VKWCVGRRRRTTLEGDGDIRNSDDGCEPLHLVFILSANLHYKLVSYYNYYLLATLCPVAELWECTFHFRSNRAG
jgi:hypothetical protein